MGKTKIEWTDVSWNPVTGCTKVSEGCRNCYAERMAKRLAGRFGYPADEPFRVTLHLDRLKEPLGWRKPRRVFVCSMGDLFHEDVPDLFIFSVFKTIRESPQHIYQILTKRPERIARLWSRYVPWNRLTNVWLGVSVEDQKAADARIPLLLETPAKVRFVSCEPLLESVDLVASLFKPGIWDRLHPDHDYILYPSLHRSGLHWVIVGGESGPGARPMHPNWVRSIRDQCQEAGIPFFFKQWGEWRPGRGVDDRRYLGRVSCTFTGDGSVPSGDDPGTITMYRVGKKAAGRELDGREWGEWPGENTDHRD